MDTHEFQIASQCLKSSKAEQIRHDEQSPDAKCFNAIIPRVFTPPRLLFTFAPSLHNSTFQPPVSLQTRPRRRRMRGRRSRACAASTGGRSPTRARPSSRSTTATTPPRRRGRRSGPQSFIIRDRSVNFYFADV